MSYLIPSNTARFELVVKKSRFIAITAKTQDTQHLRSLLDSIALEFPDARHVCHGCIIGEPDHGSISSNDDGEPAGTAGKPILNVLQHSGIGDITTVVVRYFGGIKLGAGGLVRAYSNATSGCLKQITTTIKEQTNILTFTSDFQAENTIRQTLLKIGATDITTEYSEHLHFCVKLPDHLVDVAKTQLQDSTRGQIVFIDP